MKHILASILLALTLGCASVQPPVDTEPDRYSIPLTITVTNYNWAAVDIYFFCSQAQVHAPIRNLETTHTRTVEIKNSSCSEFRIGIRTFAANDIWVSWPFSTDQGVVVNCTIQNTLEQSFCSLRE